METKSLKILVSLILIAGFSFQSIASACQLARCGKQAMMDCCKTKTDQASQYKESCCSMKNGGSSLPPTQTILSSSSETFQIRTIQTVSLTTLPNVDLSVSLFDIQSATGKPSEFRSPILRI